MEQKQLEHSNSLTDISSAVAVNSVSCESTSNQINNEGIPLPMTGHTESIDESARQIDLKSPSEISESTNSKRLSTLTSSETSSIIDSSLLDVNLSPTRSVTRRNDLDLSSLGLGSESYSPKLRATRSRSYGIRSTYTESGDLERIPLSPSLFRRPRSVEIIRIVEHLRTLQAVDKECVTLYCRFEGELESANWLHEGKPIRSGVDFRQFSPSEGLTCLTIYDVMYPEDGGNYTCVLTAKKGGVPSDDFSDEGSESSISVTCDTFLDVRKGLKSAAYRRLDKRTSYLGGGGGGSISGGGSAGRSESLLSVLQGNISPTPPVLLSTPANIVDIADGDSLSLRCRVHGSEPITIEWLHPRGHQITGGQGQEDFIVEVRPTPTGDSFRANLSINDVIGEDSGLWTFRITNKYGMAKTTMQVNVQGNPDQKTNNQLPQPPLPAIISPHPIDNFNLSRDPHTSYAAPLDTDNQFVQKNNRNDNQFDSLLPFATVRISRSSESPLFKNDLSFTMTKEFHTDYATEPRKPKRDLQKSQSLNAYDLSPRSPSLKQPKSPIRTDFQGLPFGKVSIEKKMQLNEATKFAIEIGSSSNSDQSINKEKVKETTENLNGLVGALSPTYSRSSSVSMKTSSSSNNSFGQVRSHLSYKSEKYKRSKTHDSFAHGSSVSNSRKDEIINFLQSLPESAFNSGSLAKIDISVIKDELKNNSLSECASAIPKANMDSSMYQLKNTNIVPTAIENPDLDVDLDPSNHPRTNGNLFTVPLTAKTEKTASTAEDEISNPSIISPNRTSNIIKLEASSSESQKEQVLTAKESDNRNFDKDFEKLEDCSNSEPIEPVRNNDIKSIQNSEDTTLDSGQESESCSRDDSVASNQKPSTSAPEINEVINILKESPEKSAQQSISNTIKESAPAQIESKSSSPKVVKKRPKSVGKIPVPSAISRPKNENPKSTNAQSSVTAKGKTPEPQPTLLQKPSPKLTPKIAKVGTSSEKLTNEKELGSQNVKSSGANAGVPLNQNSTLQQWRNKSNVDVSSSNQSINNSTNQFTRRRAPGSKVVNKPQISNA